MVFYGFSTSSRHCGQDLRSCATCGKETFHTLERRRDWFTLFFLPVLPLSRGLGVTRCNLCGQESIEGGGQALMSHVQAGTKTCPDCAELIRLEARLCRYCRYRFSDEEAEEAQELAEQRAVEMAETAGRQYKFRKARALSAVGCLFVLPGGLWSFVCALLMVVLVAQGKPGAAAPVLVLLWLMMSLPFLFGLFLRRRARAIRRELDGPPDEPAEELRTEENWAEEGWPQEMPGR